MEAYKHGSSNNYGYQNKLDKVDVRKQEGMDH